MESIGSCPHSISLHETLNLYRRWHWAKANGEKLYLTPTVKYGIAVIDALNRYANEVTGRAVSRKNKLSLCGVYSEIWMDYTMRTYFADEDKVLAECGEGC